MFDISPLILNSKREAISRDARRIYVGTMRVALFLTNSVPVEDLRLDECVFYAHVGTE